MNSRGRIANPRKGRHRKQQPQAQEQESEPHQEPECSQEQEQPYQDIFATQRSTDENPFTTRPERASELSFDPLATPNLIRQQQKHQLYGRILNEESPGLSASSASLWSLAEDEIDSAFTPEDINNLLPSTATMLHPIFQRHPALAAHDNVDVDGREDDLGSEALDLDVADLQEDGAEPSIYTSSLLLKRKLADAFELDKHEDGMHESASNGNRGSRGEGEAQLARGQAPDSIFKRLVHSRARVLERGYRQPSTSAAGSSTLTQFSSPSLSIPPTSLSSSSSTSSTSIGMTTPEGFSRLLPKPTIPSTRHVAPDRAFPVTPTARNKSRLNDASSLPLWTSVGRRMAMQLKYGRYNEDDEDEKASGAEAESGPEGDAAARPNDQSTEDGGGERDRNIFLDTNRLSWLMSRDTMAGQCEGVSQTGRIESEHARHEGGDYRLLERQRKDKLNFLEGLLDSEDHYNPVDIFNSEPDLEDLNGEGSNNIDRSSNDMEARGDNANNVLESGSDSESRLEDAVIERQLEAEMATELNGYQESSFEELLELSAHQVSSSALVEELRREYCERLTTSEELEHRSWMYETARVNQPQQMGVFARR
ncbi:hypothetical protein BC939DRAFT_494711 [Gamsiella multidivaricata]|uniref:uncharacterized protein n=1 Tax=Gamsiella multidivaricata TaxID=101098 RepID=UPI00221F7F4C|nr:uncharacterized protein BC939DRAFT_494711 [Gamsiella multidivaricata]KAI7820285.1 hypothetical protein BC939DRAFT_494711 [Gamsiella multidivaricata]